MNETTFALYARDLGNLLDGDVSVKDIDLEKVSRDASLFYLKPKILIYPKNKKDISKTFVYINEQKQKGKDLSVTIRSAGTCMTGGSLSDSIVLDVTRYMNHMKSVNKDFAIAEPGMYYRDFEKETLKKGWLMPSYPASRQIACIGGMVSNNAGGEKTLTYGKTEKYVKSLEVIFANGEIDTLKALSKEDLEVKITENTESGRIHKEMFSLIKDNYELIKKSKPKVSKNSSGYYLWNVYDKETGVFDLSRLIVGSQGTLAGVSASTIVGVKPKKHSKMLIMFIPNAKYLGEIIPKILSFKPETLESYDDHTFKIAVKFFKDIAKSMGGTMFSLFFQFIPEFWMVLSGGVPKIILLAEFTGDSEEKVEKDITKAYNEMKKFDFPIKRTYGEIQSKKYLTFRRESFNLLRSKLSGYRTAPTIDDIIVHPSDLPEFLPKLENIFSKYDFIYTIAGHMGDANFHIIPLVNIHKNGVVENLHKLMNEVYDLVLYYGGSLSAEHNDGLLRTPYLPKMFKSEVIGLFEKTKLIFDPNLILNPRKKVFGNMDFVWGHVDTK